MPLYSFCSVLQSPCKITKAVQLIFKNYQKTGGLSLHGKSKIQEKKEKANP